MHPGYGPVKLLDILSMVTAGMLKLVVGRVKVAIAFDGFVLHSFCLN
jgi:hypothetical protein